MDDEDVSDDALRAKVEQAELEILQLSSVELVEQARMRVFWYIECFYG